MDITTIQLRKMTASVGMVLTNGEVYGKEIYLGTNDVPENWHEITDAEYESIRDAMNEDMIPKNHGESEV